MSLRICQGCARHVREETCPFCGIDSRKQMPSDKKSRWLAVGAVVMTACRPVEVYGGPPLHLQQPDAAAAPAPPAPTVTATPAKK